MSNPKTATVVPPDGGKWLTWLGHPIRYMAIGDDTGGTYAFSWGSLPAGGGPPPYRHDFQEGFFVHRGEVAFTAGNRTVALGAGGFISIGGGTAHAFRNAGPDDAEVLVVVAPAGFDRNQAEAGRPVADASGPFDPPTPDDLGRMRSLATAYGIEFDLREDAFRVEPDVVVRRPGEGSAIAVVGDLYTFLAVCEETGGRYALWDAVIPPGGGPPPHVQTREHEGFYVLEGEIAFHADGRRVVAGPGTFLNVPPGVVHSFRNETDRSARQLIWVAPAGLEKLFAETGRAVADPSAPIPPPAPDEIAKLLAVAPKYGVEVRLPHGP
jgi:mannose-6-phosphate isomerase-like protein (cupin superfamily)